MISARSWGDWLAALALLLAVGCAKETSFPDQPITLICPWSAGGGTDRVSRQVAAQLERELKVPVNVINATGGSGVTGHTRGALARPDGYTLTMLTVELNMLHWRGLTTVNYRDFAPLVLLNRDSAALFVRKDSPFATLDDLEKAIRAQPRKLKASGTAHGGIWHVALAGWLDARGLDALAATWISINGAGPSLQELLASGVDVVCCSLPEADALLAGGQVRSLGVMAEARVPGFEPVPTFREQGHAWALAGWRGVAAPKDTPPERLTVLAAALERVARSEELGAFMRSAGFNLSVEGPGQFAATLAQQDELFRGILTGEAFRQVSAEHFGPMIFPSVIGALLLIALFIVVGEFRSERGHPGRRAGGTPALRPEGARHLRPALAVLAAVVFYLLAAEALGFLLTATVLLGGVLLLFRVRPWMAVAIAVTASVVLYQVFAVMLRVPLPRGLLGW
jgi:tripartite-type tricarboxylate transporter receptor subunit TctC